MNVDPQKNIPTILVILGATGDLMAKKIVPSLFHLFEKEKLPDFFQVVGFSRRDLSLGTFREHIAKILTHHPDVIIEVAKLDAFLSIFSYQKGVFEKRDDYQMLAKTLLGIDERWGVCSNKLFYLAVPPQFYETIFEHLVASGLTLPCSPEEGWTRVLVEKPFGKDLETAEKLDERLGKLFKEIQVYRIDHYLAKEMIQNILSFRFSNNLFEEIWSGKFIEHIDIRLLETIGVEDRGNFYDGLGALRDVGQNHLLQMLALITMDHPLSFQSEAVRLKRAEILQTLRRLSKEEIKESTFRAQYEVYQSIPGVRRNSRTETYFKMKAFLQSSRWGGVPIVLESGKRLGQRRKEVVITFKHPMPCLCPPDVEEHYKNKVIFSLEPKEGITIQFWSKKPGLEFQMEERTFDFFLRDTKRSQYTEEYEKLLLDCIAGDQTLFLSTQEVKAMWRFIDPIVSAWEKDLVPLRMYKPDTDEVLSQSDFISGSMTTPKMRMERELGIVGLGKMGTNLARRLMGKGWYVLGFNRTTQVMKELEREGLAAAYSLRELLSELKPPRVVWLMVSAGKAVDELIFSKEGLINLLQKGDIVIDGGNSFYEDSIARYEKLKKKGIRFVDVGVSGGPEGALHGASLMIGGEKKVFEKLEPLFYDLARANGYQFFEGPGAGHFVKMVHNGIEYGMMQSIAEGFALMKKSHYQLDLKKVAEVYNHGSVIESRLVGWLKNAFEAYGEDLKNVSGSVAHTGEGQWTIKTASKMGVSTPIIKGAFNFRVQSEKKPSYIGKILSALRNQFGGHKIKPDVEKK